MRGLLSRIRRWLLLKLVGNASAVINCHIAQPITVHTVRPDIWILGNVIDGEGDLTVEQGKGF